MAGLYEGTDLADKTFIGFKVSPDNGRATIEIIRNGDGVIKLPQDNVSEPYGYRTFVWTRDTLQFAAINGGHLQVTFV